MDKPTTPDDHNFKFPLMVSDEQVTLLKSPNEKLTPTLLQPRSRGKTTTVRLGQQELARLKFLEDHFGLREAQIIRMAIHEFYNRTRLKAEG